MPFFKGKSDRFLPVSTLKLSSEKCSQNRDFQTSLRLLEAEWIVPPQTTVMQLQHLSDPPETPAALLLRLRSEESARLVGISVMKS